MHNHKFIIKDSTLIEYNGPGGDVIIPDGVTRIGLAAACHTDLTSATIPNSVTRIYRYAFAGCVHLTRVFIPESVTAIGNKAFADCHLLVIHAPAGSYAERYAKKAGIPFKPTACKTCRITV